MFPLLSRGVLAIAAVAAPFIAIGFSTYFLAFDRMAASTVSFFCAIALIGGVAWAGGRLAHFLAARRHRTPDLPALPLALGSLLTGQIVTFLFRLGFFALAVLVAWAPASGRLQKLAAWCVERLRM